MDTLGVLCRLCMCLTGVESETKEPPSGFAWTAARVFPLG